MPSDAVISYTRLIMLLNSSGGSSSRVYLSWKTIQCSCYMKTIGRLPERRTPSCWPPMITYRLHIYCILSCTGWTSRSGSCISLLWWSTDVSRTRRRSICRASVCQSMKLPVVSNCDLPLVISFYWSHDIVSEHSAVGLLLWLARRSGTHWQMNCELTLVIGLN